jgi:hypothetical protein
LRPIFSVNAQNWENKSTQKVNKMKERRHHNTGNQQIRSHKTLKQVQRIAKRLGIPFTFLKVGKRG